MQGKTLASRSGSVVPVVTRQNQPLLKTWKMFLIHCLSHAGCSGFYKWSTGKCLFETIGMRSLTLNRYVETESKKDRGRTGKVYLYFFVGFRYHPSGPTTNLGSSRNVPGSLEDGGRAVEVSTRWLTGRRADVAARRNRDSPEEQGSQGKRLSGNVEKKGVVGTERTLYV